MSQVVSILRIRRHYSATAAAARSSARRFAGYTQYRDQHPDSELARDVDGLVGYMRFRDITSHRGRMFDSAGTAGSAERESLVGYIDSSFTGIHRDGKRSTTNNLSYYDLIISPERAAGLDLKAVTRATMAQLGRDAGTGGLPPWIAAEHRNTRHPHVHVVIAGIRRTPSRRYRTLQITPQRLQNMKQAMTGEIERQRDARVEARGEVVQRLGARPARVEVIRHGARESTLRTARGLAGGPSEAMARTPRVQARPRSHAAPRLRALSARLAHHYRREMQRAVRERKWASDREAGMEMAS